MVSFGTSPFSVAALFVQPKGVYATFADVDAWDEARDARRYAGSLPVVAHPPCAAWGRYAKRTPSSQAKGPLLGDDSGMFKAALAAVKRVGGVIEHPKGTQAWTHFKLPAPTSGGGWTRVSGLRAVHPAWVCEVEQGHYGHMAQKPTWLLYVGPKPPELRWGPSSVALRPWTKQRGVLESLSKNQRAATPPAFATLLLDLARRSSL